MAVASWDFSGLELASSPLPSGSSLGQRRNFIPPMTPQGRVKLPTVTPQLDLLHLWLFRRLLTSSFSPSELVFFFYFALSLSLLDTCGVLFRPFFQYFLCKGKMSFSPLLLFLMFSSLLFFNCFTML